MTKYTIEVQDDHVEELFDVLDASGSKLATGIVRQIEEQRPGLPLPNKQQAVIRTPKGVGVLAELESSLKWLFAKDDGYYQWFKDSEVGKVLQILNEGIEV